MPPSSLSRSKACVGWPMASVHVVGGIDGVEDGLLFEQAEALGNDAGGGNDLHIPQHARGEAAAELRLLDGDGHWPSGGLCSRQVDVERLQFQAIDGRRLARDAVVVHRIDAVGGDVHFKERTEFAQIEDAFDSDAAEGEVVGEGTV